MGVHDTGDSVGQVGEFVIVGRKQRLGPRRRVPRKILGDGPGDAQPVECGRAATDLVENHETS